MSAPDAEDPFAHLHDEDYAAAFAFGRVDHRHMIHLGGRARISLAGEWRFALDPFDEGLRQKWWADEPLAPHLWTVPRDYDAGAGETLSFPACWNLAKPEWLHFEGGAWHTKIVERPAFDRAASKVFLRVGAANYAARVFLNGVFLASHEGGSTPFFVELTDGLREGANRLQINVDNRRRPDRVPMNHFDWFNYGGIYREIDLIVVPAAFIMDFGAALVPDGSFGRLRFDMTLSEPVNGDARIRIPELGIDVALPINGGRGSLVVAAEPDLWSPERPRLYDVEASFEEDRVSDRVGFREIRREGTRLLLNGRDLYLKGVCVHEDDLHLGKATNEEDIRRRFADARALGCNFLRLAHYPHHERVAEIADELGVLLWSEIPVYWAIDFENPATYADAENQLLELIKRDRNRASVIVWGIGNENADTDARFSFMSRLAAAARRADATRLIGAACLINRKAFRIEDRLADELDVIGLNEYFGWYEPDYSGLDLLLANSSPDRPVIVTETGADALAGHRGGARELFTEDAQAEIYREQLSRLAKVDYVRGVCPWLLYDFRSERRQNIFQRGFNRKGLIAEDKTTRKLAFSVLEKHYKLL